MVTTNADFYVGPPGPLRTGFGLMADQIYPLQIFCLRIDVKNGGERRERRSGFGVTMKLSQVNLRCPISRSEHKINFEFVCGTQFLG